MSKFITKSLFVEFVDNPKMAWFKANKKEYYDWINKFDDEDYRNYLINLWQTAEELTKDYLENKYNTKSCNISPFIKPTDEDYDKECFISDDKDLVNKINETTLHHIKNKSKILYQPWFILDNNFLIADFLVWNEKTWKYDLYEVKAKTSIRSSKSIDGNKYSNLWRINKRLQADIGFQRYIISKWFEEKFWENLLWDSHFVYLNKYYVKKEDKTNPEKILVIEKMWEENEITSYAEEETNNWFEQYKLSMKIKNDFLEDDEIQKTINEIKENIFLSEEEFNNKYPWNGTSWLKYFWPDILKLLWKEELIEKILNHEEDYTKHTAYTIFWKWFKIPWNSKTKKEKVLELHKKWISSIEEIANNKDTFDLFAKDSKWELTTTWKFMHSYMYCKVNNEKEVFQYVIEDKLAKWKDYVIFYDYETISSPNPILKNTRPYQQVPTQVSMHIYNKKTKTMKHYGLILVPSEKEKTIPFEEIKNKPEELLIENNYVVKWNYDYFMKEFIRLIKEEIWELNNGTYIVWNEWFEKSVNKLTWIIFPELEKDLKTINDNTFDLMEIYRDYEHFHINSYGSYSIKYILPALSNKLSYKELWINKWDKAQKILENIIKWVLQENKGYKEYNTELNDLFIYCGQDSYAEYVIYDYLNKMLS